MNAGARGLKRVAVGHVDRNGRVVRSVNIDPLAAIDNKAANC